MASTSAKRVDSLRLHTIDEQILTAAPQHQRETTVRFRLIQIIVLTESRGPSGEKIATRAVPEFFKCLV
jgi:hypothetical protein